MNDIKNFRLRREKNEFSVLDMALPERSFCIPYNLDEKKYGQGAVFGFCICNLRYCSKCLLKFLPTLNSLSLIPTSLMEAVLTTSSTSDF